MKGQVSLRLCESLTRFFVKYENARKYLEAFKHIA